MEPKGSNLIHHSAFTAGTPKHWLVFLHGILGQGANWNGFAKQWVRRRPTWGAVTVDLRMHGKSQTCRPPHDVRACALDLVSLEGELGISFHAVCGHSFGSKVGLSFAEERRQSGRPVDYVWVIDADPGPRAVPPEGAAQDPTSVGRVLDALESLPATIESRAAFAELLSAHSLEESVIAWLGMNLTRVGERFELRLDLRVIRELLHSFARENSWPVIERLTPTTAVSFVLGGASSVVDTAARERIMENARRLGVSLTVIENAGHWVHVDAAAELQRILLSEIARK